MSTSTAEPEGLDWLRPGVFVTVYEGTTFWERTWKWSGVRQAAVEHVTPTGFRVAGERGLFLKKTLAGQGDRRSRQVAVPGSEAELAVLDELARRRAHDRATKSVEAWLKDPTVETRDAAVAALQGWQGLKP